MNQTAKGGQPFTITGVVNDDIVQAAASFARRAMSKWLMDIVAECNIKEFDRTTGVYINVTVYDYEGYHTQVTAMEEPRYHMRALRRHFLRDDLSHTMGIRVQGFNGNENFTIDFRDMAAIGGLTEPELGTIQFYMENLLPVNTPVNLDGHELQVTELTESAETKADGTVFYRQQLTLAIHDRLRPDTPHILHGESARRNHPYGTERAHVDAIRDILAEHCWEL